MISELCVRVIYCGMSQSSVNASTIASRIIPSKSNLPSGRNISHPWQREMTRKRRYVLTSIICHKEKVFWYKLIYCWLDIGLRVDTEQDGEEEEEGRTFLSQHKFDESR